MSARPAGALGLPAFLTVESLDDARMALTSPLVVEAHWEPERVTLHHPETDAFGYGADEAEALDDFRKAFVELFLALDGDRGALGPALRETLRVLDASVRKLP